MKNEFSNVCFKVNHGGKHHPAIIHSFMRVMSSELSGGGGRQVE
jgi:hypothetical protein